MVCLQVLLQQSNKFSAQHKIRISRNNTCQLVLAQPYGVDEISAMTKLIRNEKLSLENSIHSDTNKNTVKFNSDIKVFLITFMTWCVS
jgi:hypothetical protein